jgi:hypothetical protein
MSILVLVVLFASVGILRGQDYHFIRDHGTYRLIEPKETIVFTPPVDSRPLWLRLLRSLRPWVKGSPGTRLGYNDELDLYELDGAIGVGVRGKVEF